MFDLLDAIAHAVLLASLTGGVDRPRHRCPPEGALPTSFRRCFAGAYARSVLVEEVEMIDEPKHEAHRDDMRGNRERKRNEKALDEALENTFPASDPVSVEQPVLSTAHK